MYKTVTRPELRDRFMGDHTRLRGKASVLRSLALQVMRGDADLGRTLILKGQDLQARLVSHMRWEEEILLPALRRQSEAGGRAAEEIVSDHNGQRDRISKSLMALGGGSPDVDKVAHDLLELADWLERDMVTEERHVLGVLETPQGPA